MRRLHICVFFEKDRGSSVKEIIVRVMASLLRNEVAQEFSWLGAKRKRVFSSLKLRRVIDDIVLNQDATATKSSVEVIVKGWLKHAKARHEREVYMLRKARSKRISFLHKSVNAFL
ncbi:uncharacterized protein LOC124155317 [Ischnura elegans]|uniref:uncharacterized protein LOC124155317 n=1 Tax=Ischnura elegans TaxID=197161 RepID=UPI001ED87D68|nr:uncharacterized protein LOC124155317 [Ischnura elegans]